MLGIPQKYILGEVALVPQDFIDQVVGAEGGGGTAPFEFREYPDLEGDEIRALISERQTPAERTRTGEFGDITATDWHLVQLERFPKKPGIFAHPLNPRLARASSSSGCDVASGRSFAESLEYVALANFSRTWRDAHQERVKSGRCDEAESLPKRSNRRQKYDDVLWAALKRVYDCDSGIGGDHIEPALAVVPLPDAFVVVRLLRTHNTKNAVDFSPAFLSSADTYQKPLFVSYQLLHATRELHSRGVCLGDITLCDVAVDHNYYVTVRPNVADNIVEVDDCEGTCTETKQPPSSSQGGAQELSALLDLWRRGELSNFDYLMFLNHLCGRSCENPNYYPVLPWVRDFCSKVGGWRDLSRSKFRMNKGDQML